MPFFLSGAQLVALNFQTPGKNLQINQGWFLRNGGCGYVLKPKYLLNESGSEEMILQLFTNKSNSKLPIGFDPKQPNMIDESIDLEIAFLEGRHLFPGIKKGSDCNIQVKWEIIGSNVDTCMGTSKGMIFPLFLFIYLFFFFFNFGDFAHFSC